MTLTLSFLVNLPFVFLAIRKCVSYLDRDGVSAVAIVPRI